MSRCLKLSPLLLIALAGAAGCGGSGQARVQESPSAWQGSQSSSEYLAKSTDDAKLSGTPPTPDDAPPFEPRRVITLGQNEMVTDGSGRVVVDDGAQERFAPSSAMAPYYGPSIYGYLGGYGGYSYGRYGPSYPGSTGVEPVTRPERGSRVPDYGPPMMDKTSPAPAWR